MSVEVNVYLRDDQMATPSKWAEAIAHNQFDMEMDTDFDVQSFSGFLPCKYQGKDAGFEYYYYGKLDEDEFDSVDASVIGDRNIVVGFVTHSNMRELMTSIIAAGVLAAITDGLVFDTESGELIKAQEAISWAKKAEEEISGDLRSA